MNAHIQFQTENTVHRLTMRMRKFSYYIVLHEIGLAVAFYQAFLVRCREARKKKPGCIATQQFNFISDVG